MGNLHYFVSDIHLGLDYMDPEARERKFVRFLNTLPQNTKSLYLLGDIFDFWYEYKSVIPNKYVRTLGALAALADRGVEIHFFNGNHDIWTYSFFKDKLGFKMEEGPSIFEIEGKRFCLGHGDGLDPRDKGYLRLKSIFTNRFLQRAFSALHPRWAFALGDSWSRHNRLTKNESYQFRGNKEPLVIYSNNFQKSRNPEERADYFVFGHYHCRAEYDLESGGKLFMLGEWINSCDYLVFDGESVKSEIFA